MTLIENKTLFQFIKAEKYKNNKISPKEMRNLLEKKFGNWDSSVWNFLDFGFASYLDQFFFGTGGEYWAHAYDFPEEGINGAERIGVFTFGFSEDSSM